MILVLEDRRYFYHRGFDWRSGIRELSRAVAIQPHGGASTVDMQFVRTATGYKQKTLKRKLYEIILALLIQYRYNKIRILRAYLGCAYFGANLRGTRQACHQLYGKEPEELALEEAARVAAMLVYPKPKQASQQWISKLRRRANYGMALYPGLEKSFDKLPRWEIF
jgi:membrane peptidoglycan carboxypeptidase